jgi:hypothetical protein
VLVRISRNIILIGAFSSVLCMILLAAAVFGINLAFIHINPSDRLSLSSDYAYAWSGISFLVYDLIHIFVIWLFAFFLARFSYTLTWLGTGWLILSSLADACSLALTMIANNRTLNSVSIGNGAGSAVPFSNYEILGSTLELIQSFSGLAGYAFLIWPVTKTSGAIRAAGYFFILGFPLGLMQIAEIGRASSSTLWIDLWVTPCTEMIQHGALATFFVMLLSRRDGPQSQNMIVLSAY